MCSKKELKQISVSGANLKTSIEFQIIKNNEAIRKVVETTEKELRAILL